MKDYLLLLFFKTDPRKLKASFLKMFASIFIYFNLSAVNFYLAIHYPLISMQEFPDFYKVYLLYIAPLMVASIIILGFVSLDKLLLLICSTFAIKTFFAIIYFVLISAVHVIPWHFFALNILTVVYLILIVWELAILIGLFSKITEKNQKKSFFSALIFIIMSKIIPFFTLAVLFVTSAS